MNKNLDREPRKQSNGKRWHRLGGRLNWPNYLTLIRFVLALAFLGCLVNHRDTTWLTVGFVLFTAAAFTDLYDGILARRYDMETDFGRFMDPLADKIVTLVAFVYFIEIPELQWPSWLVIALVARELGVNSLRTLAASRGKVLAAATSGKYKAAVQMSGIGLVLLGIILHRYGLFGSEWLSGVSWTTMYLVLVLTIYSGMEYFYQNWPIIRRSSHE